MAKYKNTKQMAKSAKKEISDSKASQIPDRDSTDCTIYQIHHYGNIQAGIWLGADGENYLTGLDGLIKRWFLFGSRATSLLLASRISALMWPIAVIPRTNSSSII
jgi:hypothetical protein